MMYKSENCKISDIITIIYSLTYPLLDIDLQVFVQLPMAPR